MRSKVYINGAACISAQKASGNSSFFEEIQSTADNVFWAVEPDYTKLIPAASARRMAKGVKMSVAASKMAIDNAETSILDAIIIGTGLGCKIDSDKFVSAIIDSSEEFLTPTPFIQSTHNTVAGQIALGMKCTGYNNTYVHGSVSFESALLDAKLQLENNEAASILVGGVDELTEHTLKIHEKIKHIKFERIDSSQLLRSKSEGTIFGEGASFFITSNQKNINCYAELAAIEIINTLSVENLPNNLEAFLKANDLHVDEIDLAVLGNNGDAKFDVYFHTLADGMLNKINRIYYKHLCGEFFTASAFGFWLASKILKLQIIPEVAKMGEIAPSEIKNILLYNQYRGENHSFVLLKKC
ncbi:beta-ketoacyl synthase N-terminal-like domain-containing protein [Aequorivita echinoideorum]|uniref:Beta-ketoacyl synthase chain length factor n=1 Tax=Aequorivita echinoideorum TaxID=1549647 RepID=A0ABS5S3G1_9FLAO|nr:beta-ketoacyl synthase N-terminal-like domain-containing protein [Aequorivita echinoideorum]MBT0607745.1 beta-ketoacyl synthase chain length factor [Aequorivita echinoideorum]